MKILPALRRLATGQKETLTALLLTLLIVACVPWLPRLAKEDATVIVRCSDTEKEHAVDRDPARSHQGHEAGRGGAEKVDLQKIAEIEVDPRLSLHGAGTENTDRVTPALSYSDALSDVLSKSARIASKVGYESHLGHLLSGICNLCQPHSYHTGRQVLSAG